MLPWRTIHRAQAPQGGELILYERNGEYSIRVNGLELMSSRAHGSEEAMAKLGCARLADPASAHVLVGGLGLGYTLRATLDCLPLTAKVTVAELVAAVIEWNRGPLGPLAGHPLEDPRVSIRQGDVFASLGEKGTYDAVFLDVDNGPSAFTSADNKRLYDASGVKRAHASLKPGGVLVVWSAGPDDRFTKQLRAAGFVVETQEVSARGVARGTKHTLFIGQKPM